MDRHYFNPTPDTIYTNKVGGSYICLEAVWQARRMYCCWTSRFRRWTSI